VDAVIGMLGANRKTCLRIGLAGLSSLPGCFDDPPASDTDTAGETSAEMTVSIGGTVVASWLPPGDTPVQGTLVELLDQPGVSAVTDADGRFTIEGVPAGEVAYLSVAPSATYLGTVVGVDVPFVDVAELKLARFERIDMEGQVQALQAMDPSITYDDTRGTVFVGSTHPDTDIQMQPMPPANQHYALDMGGAGLLGATASTFFIPVVLFFNLDVSGEGAIEIAATHPMRTCDVPLPSPPILADHVSYVSVVCQ
jgi:hypothetical protein